MQNNEGESTKAAETKPLSTINSNEQAAATATQTINGSENNEEAQDEKKPKKALDTDLLAEAKESKRIGFRALLGWHYLILFAPLLINGGGYATSGALVNRQLLLYCVLAATFLVLLLFLKVSKKAKKVLTSLGCIVFTTILASAATAASSLTYAIEAPLPYYGVTVILGMTEAVMMLIWLFFFTNLAKKQTYRTLGTDVITGSLIALLVRTLMPPASIAVAVLLPLLSSTSFVTLKKKYDYVQELAEEDEQQANDEQTIDVSKTGALGKNVDSVSSYMFRRNIPSMLFALAFGLMQGSFLSSGTPFLIAYNPILFIGVTIAGLVIFFTSERYCTHADAESTYRLALICFMAGVAILAIMGISHGGYDSTLAVVLVVISGILVFAGFNLFDFGNLMLCLGLAQGHNGVNDGTITAGRFLVYAAMAVGYGLGYLAVLKVMPVSGVEVLVICCCVALLLLAITVGFPASSKVGYDQLLIQLGAQNTSESDYSLELNKICANCGSASDCAVHDALALSSMDAEKEKATLEAAELAVAEADAARAKAEAELEKAKKAVEEANAARDAVKAEAAAKSKEARSMDSKRGKSKGHDDGETFKATPWRSACAEVAKRYRLSKRETQIFHLISKGRNAEYVSNELVISIHTAKTHIANIYQKLGVHSSQEMLDLIDAFRKEAEHSEK